MNTFLDQEVISRDMHPSTTLTFTVLFTTVIGGLYLYDLFKKSKASDEHLGVLTHTVQEVMTATETLSDSIDEHDERIREKRDYDESEEVEEGKYQAWKGVYEEKEVRVTLLISREKESTIKKNQEWVSWDGVVNGSCVVRDFYLGNANPEFTWKVDAGTGVPKATVSDTLINGWDSIIKLELTLAWDSNDAMIRLAGVTSYSNGLFNTVLKKLVDQQLLQWSRVLIEKELT